MKTYFVEYRYTDKRYFAKIQNCMSKQEAVRRFNATTNRDQVFDLVKVHTEAQ